MKKLNVLFTCAILLLSASTFAQSREGTIQAAVGPGLAMHTPVRFDFDISGEYFFDDSISFGLDVDAFIRGGTVLGFVPFARYHFDLLNNPLFLPYVGGGAGFIVGTSGGAAFDLMAPDLGFEYELTPNLFVGPDVSFHLLMGDRFMGGTTSWDLQVVARVGYRF